MSDEVLYSPPEEFECQDCGIRIREDQIHHRTDDDEGSCKYCFDRPDWWNVITLLLDKDYCRNIKIYRFYQDESHVMEFEFATHYVINDGDSQWARFWTNGDFVSMHCPDGLDHLPVRDEVMFMLSETAGHLERICEVLIEVHGMTFYDGDTGEVVDE